MKAVAYLKTTCGWSAGVREVLSRYNIDYEEKIINDPDIYAEMVTKTGQPLSPCVESVSYTHLTLPTNREV